MMNDMDNIPTFLAAIETFGRDVQKEMAIEEMGELIVALQHHKRLRNVAKNVCEEIADCFVVLNQLALLYSLKRTQEYYDEKMERLRERIAKNQPNGGKHEQDVLVEENRREDSSQHSCDSEVDRAFGSSENVKSCCGLCGGRRAHHHAEGGVARKP